MVSIHFEVSNVRICGVNHCDIFVVLQFQILVAAYGHQNIYVACFQVFCLGEFFYVKSNFYCFEFASALVVYSP